MDEKAKLEIVLDEEGCDEDGLRSMYMGASNVPGVCMNDDCTFTAVVDAECEDGFCSRCMTDTVKSALLLLS